MNTRSMLCSILVCASACAINPALAQEKKPGAETKTPAMPGMDEMMKKWMEAITPGDNHKRLADMVGSWETTSSVWMQGPGNPPAITKGTAEFKLIMDGRYLLQESKGEMMGMPFTGMGVTGYDNFNKKYVSFWIDNLSTAMFTSEGAYDQSGKVLTLYGKMDEPMTGEHDKNVKYVSRTISPDKHVFEIHDLAIGEPNTKVAEVVYARKK